MADNHPPENNTNEGGGGGETGQPENVGSKRQRKPSVRLGDIVSDESHVRRTSKNIKNESKSSKNRPLMNSSEDPNGKDANLDSVIGTWNVKESKKRGFKRVRSNWPSRTDVGARDGGGEDEDIGCRDFDRENLGSPGDEVSLGKDVDDLGGGDEGEIGYRRNKVGYNGDGNEFSGPSDTEGRECRRSGSGDDEVRIWLNGLGLGRYVPVFEIHEVDIEVLPLLTLEDLKDMGINAVGSRRKMFCAIQKLGKGFS